jgi:hypothetical protein|tara:strand:- start:212 stop:487 length:276 start_codon:yes stop_codon:yes gene_type:complete
MGKLCPRGKAAAKSKFKVYPSAYANMYASAVCSGKVTPGGKKKPQKKANGGSINFNGLSQKRKKMSNYNQGGIAKGCGAVMEKRRKVTKRA